jgi:signal transduction histidine kinase
MQRQFIANVSHDLRSPLTSIIGFSQVLTEDAAIAPAQRRTAEIIHSEAQRLYRLTMDLLDLSRLEAGRLPLSKRPLDLNATLHEVAARYQALPNKRGVRFAENLCAEPLPVVGDPDRLTQVVVNLLDNALKFCNPGGEVRLTSARQGGSAVIEVYNSGAGIAPEDLPHIFDRFYRSDHPRAQQTGGSGIGLAIVRELVHVHGGAVTAASELGHGTTMAVHLPLASTAAFTKGLQVANTDATDSDV